MEVEDRHLCILCNQTISGLLNYVLHRKNNCSNQKMPLDQDHFSEQVVKVEVKHTEDQSSNIIQSKSNELLLSNEKAESQAVILLQDNSLVQVQPGNSKMLIGNNLGTKIVRESQEKIVGEGETSLFGSCFDNNVSNVHDSNKEGYVYSVDDTNDDYCDDGELNYTGTSNNQHNHVSEDIKGQDGLFGQCNAGEVSDNVKTALIDTTESSLTEIEPVSKEHKLKADDSCIESEFGILSFNVNGSSKKLSGLDVKDGQTEPNDEDKVLKTKGNNKRKTATTRDNKRNDEKVVKRRRRVSKEKKFDEELDKIRVESQTGSIKVEGSTTEETKENTTEGTKNVQVNVSQDANEGQENQTSGRIENIEYNDKIHVYFDPSSKNKTSNQGKTEGNTFTGSTKSDQDSFMTERQDIDVNESHACTVCCQLFPSKHKLLNHLLTGCQQTQASGQEEEQYNLIERNQRAILIGSPFRCDMCMFYFNSSFYLEQHLKSKTHKENLATADGYVMCSLCKFVAKSNFQMITHFRCQDHVKKAKLKDQDCVIQFSKIQKKKIKVCKICPSEFNKTSSSKKHFETAEHIRRKLALQTQTMMVDEDDYDVNIQTDLVNNDNQVKKNEYFELEVDNQLKVNENMPSKDLGIEVMENSKDLTVSDHSTKLSDGSAEVHAVSFENADHQKKVRLSICKFCAFETRNYSEMRIHYMKEHSQMVKICEVCDIVFPHGRGYKLHVNSKDHQMNLDKSGDKNLYQCHVCMKKFVEESYAKFHTAYFHYHLNSEEDLLREGGESITRTKYANFLETIKGIRKNDQVSCPECGAFLRQVNMIGHLRIHTGEKPFKCNLCSETFFNTYSLRRHLVLHFECWEKSCEVCGEIFKCPSSYNCHMDIHKAKVIGSGKSNVCHICGDSFYVKRKLQEHMLSHSEKTLKCDFPGCIWKFSTNHALKRHKLTHTTENPFICPTCGYATKSEKYLKKHEQNHTKEKEFVCEHCPYKAMTKTHLRRHMRIHLGVKPFKCPYCSYACNTHDNIRKHILETSFHKGLKVYPCILCSYSTNCTKEYRTHIRLEHKEIPDENIRGSSLAALSGLFNKEEELKAVINCKEILPCKERKQAKKKKPAKVSCKETLPQEVVIEEEIVFAEMDNL